MTEYFKFSETDHSFVFTGDTLEIYIPERYQEKGFLQLGEHVSVLGIFSMKINDKEEVGFLLPAMINMDPIDIAETTINGEKYFVCTLNKGCVFHDSDVVLQNNGTGYFMWNEFLALGHMPKFITYGNIIGLFDNLAKYSGLNLNGAHTILELIYAHMFRDANNMTKFYRHTDMSKPPAMINLHDVAYGATTTHSRIAGSYTSIGLNSALLNQETKNNELEDIFRQ